MKTYEPMVKETLSHPEIAVSVLPNNVRPTIRVDGSTLFFGELVNGAFAYKMTVGELDLTTQDAETILNAELDSFSDKMKPHLTLMYNDKIIKEGLSLGEKKDETAHKYEIKPQLVCCYNETNMCCSYGEPGYITVFGLDLEQLSGFNAGELSKKESAHGLASDLNHIRYSKDKTFIPDAGGVDYGVVGSWCCHNNEHMDFYEPRVELVVKRNQDQTLEVIPRSVSFKQIVTPEIIQQVIGALEGK